MRSVLRKYYLLLVCAISLFTANNSLQAQNVLDLAGLTSATPAAAAYATRKLSSSYTGAAVRIRRQSDNAVADLAFDVNGNISANSLATFVSGGTGSVSLGSFAAATNAFVNIWYDQSGNGRNATQTTAANQPLLVSNGVIVTSTVLNSKATLSFNGSGQFMDLPMSSSIINAAGTISAVQVQPVLQSGFNAVVAWSLGGGTQGPGFGPLNSAGAFGLYTTWGPNNITLGPVAINQAYVLNATWSGNGSTVVQSRNGTIVNGSLGASFNYTGNAWIGRDVGAFYNGNLAELIVSNTTITAGNRTAMETNQNNAYTNAGALNFDGSNDYVNLGNILGASYTKEAWVNISNASAVNNFISGGVASKHAFWAPNAYGNKLSAGHNDVWNQVQDPTALVVGQWYHVAVTYDAPTTTMKLYKNGVLVSTNNAVPAYLGGGNLVLLGAYDPSLNLFSGSLDETRIWSRVLCQTEIQNNMNAMLSGTQTGLTAYYKFNQGITGANNSAITTVTDASGNNNTGTMVGFNFTGSTSNWIAGTLSPTALSPVFTNPPSVISGASSICVNGTTTLTNASSGTWSSSNTAVATVSASGLVTGVSAGTTVITFTGICSGVKTLNFTVNALPTVTASSNTPVNAGTNINLTASGATTYSWTGPNAFVSTTQNPTIANAQLVNAGVYTVTGTTNGCPGTATATVVVNALPATALALDGANDYVKVADNASLDFGANDFTIETWTLKQANTVSYSNSGLVGKWNTGAVLGSNEWVLNNTAAGMDNKPAFWIESGNTIYQLNGTTVMNLNQWYHLAVVRKDNLLSMYVNGVLNVSITIPAGTVLNNVGRDLLIGAYSLNAGNPTIFSSAKLDELKIWNRALCQAEIQNNRNGELTGTQNGLIAYYKFNQGFIGGNNVGITTLTDASGNNNNGTMFNFASTATGNWVAGNVTGNSPTFVPTTAPITGTASACIGATSTLANTNSGTWSSSNNLVATVNAAGQVTAIAAGTTTITFTNTCGGISTTTFTVNPKLTASISTASPLTVCLGGAVLLDASTNASPATYQWFKNGVAIPTATNASFNAIVSGSYTVVVANANGCVSNTSNALVVTIEDIIKPFFSSGGTVTSATNAQGQVLATSAQGAVVTYNAPVGADNCTVVSNILTAGFESGSVFPIGTTTVTYTVTDGAGLTETSSFDIVVSGLAPSLTAPANITVNNDEGQCGAAVSFAATGSVGVPAATITYTEDGQPVVSGSSFAIGVHSITATATNAVGSSSVNFTITVVNTDHPTITAQGPTNFCEDGSVTLTASEGSSYYWSTGETSQSITVYSAGTYSASVTNAFGCATNTNTITTTTIALPTAPEITGAEQVCANSSTVLASDITGGVWTSANESIATVDAQGKVTGVSEGSVQIMYSITNESGCTSIGYFTVYVKPLPLPGVITGVTDICVGGTSRLDVTNLNGRNDDRSVWTTSNANVVTIGEFPSGIDITGIGLGTATITKTLTINGCTAVIATAVINVRSIPIFTVIPENKTAYNITNQCNALVSYIVEATGVNTPTLAYSFTGATIGSGSGTGSGQSFNVGITNVTITATNQCGSSSVSFTVTVRDIQDPVISAQANISVNATSAAGAMVTYVAPVGTDNCSATTVRTAGLASGSVFPIGTTTVTYTVTDASGNTASASFTVTVTGLAPVIVAPANISVNATTNTCGASVSFAATEATAIPASTITYTENGQPVVSGATFSTGVHTITATATNAVGSSSASFTITVVDNQAPVITAPADITVNASANCNAIITVPALIATDNCTVTGNALKFDGANDFVNIPRSIAGDFSIEFWMNTTQIGPNAGGSQWYQGIGIVDAEVGGVTNDFGIALLGNKIGFGVGAPDRTIFSSSNVNTGNWVHIAATRQQSNGQIKLYVNGVLQATGTGSTNLLNTPSRILIGLMQTGANGFYNGAITKLRLWNTVRTATEISNNSSATLSAQTGLVANYEFNQGIANGNNSGINTLTNTVSNTNHGTLNNFGLTGANSNWVAGVSSASVTVTNNFNNTANASGMYQVGITNIVWTATDAAGNASTYTQKVTVLDVTPPTITNTNSVTYYATSAAGAMVTYPTPVGMDNCSGVATVLTTGLPSGSTFPIGVTTVTYTATDAAGLTASTSFTVTVVGIAPVIVVPENILQNNDAGLCGASVSFAATETTAIPASTIVYTENGQTIVSGHFFSVGTHTITATASNAVGSSSGTFTITVKDVEKPTITVAAQSQSADAGVCQALVTVASPVTADNCAVASVVNNITGTNNASAVYPVGTTTIIWTVTDIHGNITTATQNITVKDEEKPIALTQNITVQLNASGAVSITAAQINNGSTDNCGIASITIDKTSFYCSNVGANTVTLTVTDIHGNVSTATAVVTVQDNIAPVAIAKNITVGLSAVGGTVSITAADVNNGSSDACGIASMTVMPSSFSCANVGANTVTLTVTDVNGNVSTTTAIVTVVDDKGPVPTAVLPVISGQCSVKLELVTKIHQDGDGCNSNDREKYHRNTKGKGHEHHEGEGDDDDDDDHENNGAIQIIAPTAMDNCSGLIKGTTTDPLVYNNQGTYIIHWKFVDARGNVTIQEQTVIVKDTQAPTPKYASLPTITGQCSVSLVNTNSSDDDGDHEGRRDDDHDGDDDHDHYNEHQRGAPWAKDNCSGWVRGTTTDPLTYSVQGTYIIHWTYNDGHGNISTQNQTVIVKDITKPKIKAPNDKTVTCGSNTAPAVMGMATATDNCSVPVITYTDVNSGNQIVRTWRATDAAGNFSTDVQVIKLSTAFSGSVVSVPTSNVYTGGEVNNLYLGYGAQGTALTVTSLPSSGAPYTYSWSGVAINKLSATNTAAPVFSPTAGGVYTFTVTMTNKNGCSNTASISICVTDIRVPGSNGALVYVCHKGNGKSGGTKTLQVPVAQVASHIQTGNCGGKNDRLGSCDQNPCNSDNDRSAIDPKQLEEPIEVKPDVKTAAAPVVEELKVVVMPNPTTTYFTIRLESKDKAPVNLRVMDGSGRVIDAKQKMEPNSSFQMGHGYSSGTYYAEFIQGNKRKVIQLIKVRG